MIYKNHVTPESVLFCCTMNSIRSPMAAALLKHIAKDRFYVESVGIHNKRDIDGFAIAVMAEINIDISDHITKDFKDLADDYFDVIIALSPESQHHAVDLTRTMACEPLFWNVIDPSLYDGVRDEKLIYYRMARDALQQKITYYFGKWINEMEIA